MVRRELWRRRNLMRPQNRSQQRGVALFISLVLLLVLTIVGVSAVQNTSLEVRMARNEQDSLLAFQAAESALRDAEAFLDTITSTAAFVDNGAQGLWTIADYGQTPRWEIGGIWNGGQSVVAPNAVAGVAAQPRYIVEHVASVVREDNAYQLGDPYTSGSADRVEMFRVTARGVGGTVAATATLQSTFGRVFN